MLTLVGGTIGNYRIEELLGSGGMGEVFRGVHILLNRPAAIKVLHATLATDPTFRARFQQEAQAAAALKHPNIVEIYDFGEQDGRFYLAMELATVGSLRTLLQRRAAGQPWPLSLGLDLVRQAAEGLAYAHAHGMIHRDIKPDNLLLNPSGEPGAATDQYVVKIGDFGLARMGEGSGLTASGVVMGTPAYMSPEQCQGEALDGRTDLYSLGIVLYEVATGYVPFQAKTMSEAAYKHVYTLPLPPRQVQPELPIALETIILRCLAKKPEERYATGTELARALHDVMDEVDLTSVVPIPPTLPPTQLQPPAQTATPAPQLVSETETANLPVAEGSESIQPSVPSATGAKRLAIILEQETLALTPGQPATMKATLANLGQTVDHLKVMVEGAPSEWVQIPSEALQLNPGAQLPVLLTVTAPKVATSRADDYPVTVRAESQENPAESASAHARWTVLPFTADSLSLRPERTSGRGHASFEITLHNDSNAPEQYALHGEDAEEKLAYHFAQESASVAPGTASTLGLVVSGRRRWVGRREQPYPFAIRAQPSGERHPLSASGQFVNVPMLSNWMIAAIVLMLAALGVALFLVWPRPSPSITVDPNPVNFGGVAVETSTSRTVTVSNTGSALLKISKIEITGPNVGDFNITPATLLPIDPAKSTVLTITFKPNVTGNRSAILELTDNAAGSPHKVQLNGQGVGQGVGVAGIFVPNIAGFTGYEPVSILIKSTGSAPLVISRVTIGGNGASVFNKNLDASDCIGKPLPPNSPSGRCSIRVQVTDGFEGTASATLQIYDNAPGSPHWVLLEARVLR